MYKSPLVAANVKNLGLRVLYPVDIHFDYFPPNPGKNGKLKDFRKMKEHVEFTATILPVLETDELFSILTAIQIGEVHSFWQDCINRIWTLKVTNQFKQEIVLNNGKFPLWFGNGEAELEIIKYSEDAKMVSKYD